MKQIQPMRHDDCPPSLQALQRPKQGTPTMGGVFVLGVAVGVAGLFGGFSGPSGWIVFGTMVGVGLVGVVDDLWKLRGAQATGLRCLPKLLAVLAIGLVAGLGLSHPSLGPRQEWVPWLGRPMTLGWAWVPLAALVITGSAHAVNLTDGMDGLAAGCLAIAFTALGLLAAQTPTVMVWCLSLAGACAGFLWFNAHPASVFLGDVGALGLGAALGVLALVSHAALALLIVGGVFVAEAVSVMVQVASYRWRNKKRIFRVAPLHHHFQLGGIGEQKLVVRFWIVGLLLAALGVTALRHS